MKHKALVVEDDREIGRLVKLHLADVECNAELVTDGATALERFKSDRFDLVVLDLMLPGLDGLSLCRQIRALPGYVPILMLTARSTELDRVLGLEMGADDYLTKPFSVRELVARVKALFRRVEALETKPPPAKDDTPIKRGPLLIDPEKRRVQVNGRDVTLTAKEFDLLLHFARAPGKVYNRVQLLDQVWGYNHEGYEHTVNSHINRLRSKIESDPSQPEFIITVWGVGYKFNDELGAAE
jgi:two-component system OmpR family response regulator